MMDASLRRKSYLAFLFILIVIVSLRFAISPYYFADFDSYLYLSDYLSMASLREVISYEPLSSLGLIGYRLFTGNSYEAIILAYWITSIVFLICIYYLSRSPDVDWQGLIILFGLYGSLLAFVTVRATPAYILVALSCLYLARGRWIGFLIFAIAIGFHISAIFALPALILCFAQSKILTIQRVFAKTYIGISIAIILFATLGLFYNQIIDLFSSVIGVFSTFMGKYSAYLADGSSGAAARQTSEGTDAAHLAYMGLCTALAALFLLQKEEACVRLRAYVVVSYAIFAFLSFSPVVAFRQSIFWMMPMLLLIPWRRYAFAGFGSTAIVIASAGMFALGMSQVIQ